MTQGTDSAIEVTLLGGTAGPGRGEGDFFSMLEAALDGILEACEAERGMVHFFEDVDLDQHRLIRTRPGVASSGLGEASVLVQQAKISCKPVFEEPAKAVSLGEPANDTEANKALGRAALCVPIRQRGGALGAVYLERLGEAFNPETLSVVAWFAQMIETELRRRRQPRWRWRTVDVSRQLAECVVA